MSKGKTPPISVRNTARIFREMVSLRRYYCADSDFFRMDEFWEWLADTDDSIGIRLSNAPVTGQEKSKVKAGVVAVGEKSTLVAPRDMFQKAKAGSLLHNFVLAHEFGHLALEHHASRTKIINYQLDSSDGQLANIPPNLLELEANYAAVFFQCGVELFNTSISELELAKRASSDPFYVGKAKAICRLEAFQNELRFLQNRYERVVL